MKKLLSRLLWVLALTAAGVLPAAEPVAPRSQSMSEKTLKEIVARQRDVFARAEKEGDHLDQAWLRGELQSVISSYDILIQKNPDFAPGYVAYGLLLGKVGMVKEAVGILLKANKLDGEIPLVKNEIGRFLAEDGKLVDALPWITAAIELEPKEPLYHYHLGKLLTEGRDDLIKTGQFTRPKLDDAMLAAFAKAAELAPDNFAYAYRHAEAYYDLETPRWDEAFALWGRLDARVESPLEHQTLRLHQANILLKQGRAAEARVLLDSVTEIALAKQKQTLLDSLAKAEAK